MKIIITIYVYLIGFITLVLLDTPNVPYVGIIAFINGTFLYIISRYIYCKLK